MALSGGFTRYGKLKLIENALPKMGSAFSYWFLKVRSGSAEWQEEHWLVTEPEAERFVARAAASQLVSRPDRLGLVRAVKTAPELDYGSVMLDVRYPDDERRTWVLTPHDVEEIRQRAEKNAEDIEANREGWLADLLD